MTQATFSRLRHGDWGLRVTGKCQAGMRVTVTKRDGSSSQIIIGRVLWEGDDYTLCTIGAEPKQNESGPRTTRPQQPLPPDDGSVPFDGPYVDPDDPGPTSD